MDRQETDKARTRSTSVNSERRSIALGVLGALGGSLLLQACDEPATRADESESGSLGQRQDLLSGATSVRWCDTVAEQQAVKGGTTTTSVNVVIRRGRTTPADGGGGVFIWTTDTTTPQTADPTHGTLVVPTGTRTGCWKRLASPVLDARWFGAIGDGVAADGPALQAALNAAANASMAGIGAAVTLYVPAGTYLVHQNLGLTNANGIRVIGAGMNATIIRDGRPDAIPYGPTGLYHGLLSFVTSQYCGIQDLTLQGACTVIDPQSMSQNGRMATYFSNSPHCYVERVRGTSTRDECIYADGPASVDWRVNHCIVESTNSNGINLNTGEAEGAHIHDNWIRNCYGNGINVAAKTCVIHGNTISVGNTTPIGSDLIVVDSSSRAVITGNLLYDSDTSVASCGGIRIFGSELNESCHLISGNILKNIHSDWDDGVGAGISLTQMAGTVLITNNIVDGCGRTWAPDGRAISIGSATGNARFHITGNTFRNTGTRNIRVGVKVHPGIPAGIVTIGENFCEGLTRPYELGAPSAVSGIRRTVATTGLTVLPEHEEYVFVSANGPTTVQLPAASLFTAGAKRICVKNSASQLGTTTVSASSSLIDASATTSLVGPNSAVTVVSDGVGWLVVARV